MNQESRIAGSPTMITETLYKPQEDYMFVNKIKVKEFIYNPNFKREPEGPFISEYYQHYEADKPQPNSLYSPIRITKENVNRQCNPLVAYPFGVPHKYEEIKCPKCKGNATFGKKRKTKKNKINQENDLFTSSLKKESPISIACWSNGKSCADNHSFSSCADHSYTHGNFKTASFKSIDPLESRSHDNKTKDSLHEEENYENQSSEKHHTNEYIETEETSSPFLNKPSSCQTEEGVIPSASYSLYSNSYMTDTNKHTVNHCIRSLNHPKLYTLPYPTSEGIITSNELSSSVPRESMQDKTSPRGKGKLYLKLNNMRINEYSNVLSSEGVNESYPTDQTSERAKKSDEKSNKEIKKVKITVNRKNGKRKTEEELVTSPKGINEMVRDNIHNLKKKSLKLKTNQLDAEKSGNKQKAPLQIASIDQSHGTEQETKQNKESIKKMKNKKSTPIRTISITPSSVRKTSGETNLRMCKMQLAIDTQLKNKQINPSSNKGLLTSEEDLFGSNSSRNVYSKSRVIYLQEKKKEPQRKISKEGYTTNNIKQKLSIASPRTILIHNSSEVPSPKSTANQTNIITLNTNVNLKTNINQKNKITATSDVSQESNINQNEMPNIEKKKTIQANQILAKGISKENVDRKTKKGSITTIPGKIPMTNKNNKITNKNVYQKKPTLTKKASSKVSNNLTDRKIIDKKSVASEVSRETTTPKKTTKKSVSGFLKNSNGSVNKALINNNTQEISKSKNGLLKKKAATVSVKNAQDPKKNATSINSKGINEIQIKKLTTALLKKKKTLVEEPNPVGNKNRASQIEEEENKKRISSVSDSALVNENEEIVSKMEVKFGRSETKLYMPNDKIVPFKKTEVKMVTKKDSGKIKAKVNGKVNRTDTTTQRKVKELAKTKKSSDVGSLQSSLINKNMKGTLKNKKKELFDNIMLLTKSMAKKSESEEKMAVNPESKKGNSDSQSEQEILSSKIKRTLTIKDKKKELFKKEKKEASARVIKRKEKIILEKKEKKGDELEE